MDHLHLDHEVERTVWPPLTARREAMLTRLGLDGALARDAALAVVIAVATGGVLLALFALVVDGADVAVGDEQRWAIVATACVQALLLAVRRVGTVGCLALVVVCQLLVVAASPPDLAIRGVTPFVAAYTVGTLLPTGRTLGVAAGAALVEALGAVLLVAPDRSDVALVTLGAVVTALLTYVVPALVGTSVATRRRYIDLVRLRASEVLASQRATVRAALVAERGRMARELHDVAAHHLSGMVVQAAAVERLIDRDPRAAKEGAGWIRTQGKQTLDDLRQVVGVLRERPDDADDPPAPSDLSSPVPGLAALDELIEASRLLGTPVQLAIEGEPHALSSMTDAALYRVAQEALSNVRQHARGAPARITIAHGPRAVRLEVRNNAGRTSPERPGPGGVGLVGMRERADLVGASFVAGPTTDGGWSVEIVAPVHA